MSDVVNIENRGRGQPQYPVYAWRVNLHGAAPIYCASLKEAKRWAAEYGGVMAWERTQDYHHITYTPRKKEQA